MGCECGNTCTCGCHHGSCDCGCCSGFERRFATKAEQLDELEGYLAELQKEVQAVEERIADLKK
jgi:hypothetical protein